MRKIILFNMVTLDGFFAGLNGEIDWHQVDEEFNDFAVDQLNKAGGFLFGRVTYDLMASYWPTPEAVQDDPGVAGKMNALPKYVFSRTLARVDWNNSHLIQGDAAGEAAKLKQQAGGDLLLFGSATLAAALTAKNLIDEYRLMVNPVILGRGRPLFQNIQERHNLKLLEKRSFQNGNVLLCYGTA